uniref:Candidate secreted effector n=1 Tax=Meloidogyne incognita TaxID=6306 RepID=A0A914N1N8_MELIC
MITLKYNQWSILQLASIWCLRANGIPEKYFYQFQEVFLHRYGFDQLLILYQLSINGLLYKNNTSFSPLFKARNPFSKRLTNKSDKQLAPINLPTKNEMRGQLSESLNSIINGLQLIPQNDEEQQKKENKIN